MQNNPALSTSADDPQGVPISAIIFGGRRASTIPLIFESFDWNHGVYLGATMGSETTAAADGQVGLVRRDPMAMLPFCGYNMGDYFAHWLSIGERLRRPPRIFMVNWFRKDSDGSFLWPGYSENMRVLKWITDRVRGRITADETPVGYVPMAADLDLTDLDMSNGRFDQAMAINVDEWKTELDLQAEFFAGIGDALPPQFNEQHEGLKSRLKTERASVSITNHGVQN
jgi:phosphoenolpyruvate carboxykinase (GTP)